MEEMIVINYVIIMDNGNLNLNIINQFYVMNQQIIVIHIVNVIQDID